MKKTPEYIAKLEDKNTQNRSFIEKYDSLKQAYDRKCKEIDALRKWAEWIKLAYDHSTQDDEPPFPEPTKPLGKESYFTDFGKLKVELGFLKSENEILRKWAEWAKRYMNVMNLDDIESMRENIGFYLCEEPPFPKPTQPLEKK